MYQLQRANGRAAEPNASAASQQNIDETCQRQRLLSMLTLSAPALTPIMCSSESQELRGNGSLVKRHTAGKTWTGKQCSALEIWGQRGVDRSLSRGRVGKGLETLRGKMQHESPIVLVRNPRLANESFPVLFNGHRENGREKKVIQWNPTHAQR